MRRGSRYFFIVTRGFAAFAALLSRRSFSKDGTPRYWLSPIRALKFRGRSARLALPTACGRGQFNQPHPGADFTLPPAKFHPSGSEDFTGDNWLSLSSPAHRTLITNT